MDRFFAYSRNLTTGAPVGGATITVYDSGTANLATIFADNLSVPTPKTNPFLADSDGFFFFYATPGRYDVRLEGGGSTPIPTPYTWGDVTLGETHAQRHVLATSSGLGPDHTVSGLTAGHVLTAISSTQAAFQNIAIAGVITDHGVLTGLLDDDHTQYPLIVGRLGGQILRGGTAPSESLELDGTLSATKGPILLNKSGGNVGIGLGSTSPTSRLQVNGVIHSTSGGIKFPDGTTQITAAAGGGSGQWISVGQDVYNANLGNVGINTALPLRRLHVQGGPSDTELLRLASITGRAAVLEFLNGVALGARISVDSESAGIFNGNSTGSLRINQSTGYVSLGPATAPNSGVPPMPFYVTTSPGVDDTVGLDSAAGEEASINFLSGGTRFGRLGGGSTLLGLDSRVAGVVTGNVSLKVANGYCGIGTTSPQRRVHVVDSISPVMRLETTGVGVDLEIFDGALGALGYVGASPAGGYAAFSNGPRTGSIIIRQSTGYVGIVPDTGGFSVNPARPFEVESLATVPIQIRCRGRAGGSTGIELYSGADRRGALYSNDTHLILENKTGGSELLAISQAAGGFVSIGNVAAVAKLDVTGDVHASNHTTSSDRRFKEIRGTLQEHYRESVLDLVCRLEPVAFRWNKFYREDLKRGVGSHPLDTQIGLVAQDVEAVFPELVYPWLTGDQPEPGDPNGQHYYGLYYDRFVAVLIEAVKELRSEIARLRKEIH